MLFNSIDFAIFLPIVFTIYWILSKTTLRIQNAFIVLASYYFYASWDWRFLFLIIISTSTDYIVGLRLNATDSMNKRKILLLVSLLVNVGILGFFKYYNFFQENFVAVFKFLGADIKSNTLNIILPVGISFYTFQTLSYTIDIYRKKLLPTKDFFAFYAFVSFFPQLVAGPIERATNLLPQIASKRVFRYGDAVEGMRQILWGMFKKVVIADNCAVFVDMIFSQPEAYNGSTVLLGGILFAFQVYGDFSGYSDIAIGTAKLFGIRLMQNFAYPFFSRDMAEFWRRWHISLTTWFRDYLYIPLGGSRVNQWKLIRNVFVIYVVSGFWHGADWNFVLWGFLNALYFLPLLILKINRTHLDIVARGKLFPSIRDVLKMLWTFFLFVLGLIVFRAESLNDIVLSIAEVFSRSLFEVPDLAGLRETIPVLCLTAFMLLVEWFGREKEFALSHLGQNWNRFFRWSAYALIVFLIGMYMQTDQTPFFYFQF